MVCVLRKEGVGGRHGEGWVTLRVYKPKLAWVGLIKGVQ